MSSNNLVKEITNFDELLTTEYGKTGSLEREKFHAKASGWEEGHQDGYLQALKDVESGVVDINDLYRIIKKLEGDE